MSGDFVRRLPGGATSFRNHRGAFTWFNLDPWLMLILLSIVSFGLVVLHSASDGNWVVVEAQLVRLGLGFGLMILIAQIPPYFLLRTAPLLYGLGLILLLLIYPFGTEVNGSMA
jgi:rod shape determining protein RodA